MKQPNDSEYVLLREKQDPVTKRAVVNVKRNNGFLDLSDYEFFSAPSATRYSMDRYVHKDDYAAYVKMFTAK